MQEKAQRLDELEMRLTRAQRHRLRHYEARLETLSAQLERHNPAARLRHLEQRHAELGRRLELAIRQQLKQLQQRLGSQVRALETVSPLATLSRGYAIVSETKSGKVLHSSAEARVGDTVHARLHQGGLLCRIEEIEYENP